MGSCGSSSRNGAAFRYQAVRSESTEDTRIRVVSMTCERIRTRVRTVDTQEVVLVRERNQSQSPRTLDHAMSLGDFLNYLQEIPATNPASDQNRNQPAASLSSLDRFGLMIYQLPDGSLPNSEIKRCPICILDFVDGSSVVKLDCTHLYHFKCFEHMFKFSTTCALCRRDYAPVANR